jgi:hypothetical protein
MATDYTLSKEHDKLIHENDYVLVSGSIETAQAVEMRLLTMENETAIVLGRGVPWEPVMFKTDVRDAIKKQILVKTILETPGVKRLYEFQYGVDPVNKGALVEYRGETIYTGEDIEGRIEI